MHLTVEIACSESPPPPSGAPIIVQVRDTSYQDVAAKIVAEARAKVHGTGETLATVTFDAPAENATIWAHVDVDRDGEVSKGDYITKRSFPAQAGGPLRVLVSRVA